MSTDSPPLSKISEITTIIDAERKTWFPDFQEVWRYRDLLSQLAWRDISARYRQSVVGFGWAFVRPLISVFIYTLIFSRIVKIDTGGIPYPLFNMSGLIAWMYFVSCIQVTTSSITTNGHLLSKVYIPRLIIPLSSIASASIEFIIQLFMVQIVFMCYGYTAGIYAIYLPISSLLIIVFALGTGLWLTSINVKFRDIGLALPFFLQIGLYLVPVIYPTSMVPEAWRFIYKLNPLVNLIDFFRFSLLSEPVLDMPFLIYSIIFSIFNLTLGVMFFHRMERTFADTI